MNRANTILALLLCLLAAIYGLYCLSAQEETLRARLEDLRTEVQLLEQERDQLWELTRGSPSPEQRIWEAADEQRS